MIVHPYTTPNRSVCPLNKGRVPPKDKLDPIWAEKDVWLQWYINKYFCDHEREVLITESDSPLELLYFPWPDYECLLCNVHRLNFREFELPFGEKCRRAREEQGIRLGLRDALLCWLRWREIPLRLRRWNWVFPGTVIEIDGYPTCPRLIFLADIGCSLSFMRHDLKSGTHDLFPVGLGSNLNY